MPAADLQLAMVNSQGEARISRNPESQGVPYLNPYKTNMGSIADITVAA